LSLDHLTESQLSRAESVTHWWTLIEAEQFPQSGTRGGWAIDFVGALGTIETITNYEGDAPSTRWSFTGVTALGPRGQFRPCPSCVT
jgi:hypothetical protein